MRPCCFLDRDGVVVEDRDFLSELSDIALIPGSAEAIATLNRDRIPVVIVSNQSGVARGLFPKSRVIEINAEIDRRLAERDAHIDAWFFCPHHPEGTVPEYRVDCDCRKPEPGMLLRAAEQLGLDTHRSFIIGDRGRDLEAGHRVGARGILVRTGYGLQESLDAIEARLQTKVDEAPDLAGALVNCRPQLLKWR